jgi:hypothetical protein
VGCLPGGDFLADFHTKLTQSTVLLVTRDYKMWVTEQYSCVRTAMCSGCNKSYNRGFILRGFNVSSLSYPGQI